MSDWTQKILCRVYGHEWMFADNPFQDVEREPLAPIVCHRCGKRGLFPQTIAEVRRLG